VGVVTDKTPNGSIRRGLRVGKLGIGLVGSYLGHQMQNLLLRKSSREERRKDFHRRVSKRVRDELGTLKGAFMKFGQILSMQTQILPDETIEELAHLQMQAPGMHPTLARVQFKTSCGKYPEDVFLEFDPEHFAAASLGQVHRAVTRNGEKVAVKIQYPAIRSAIENDFEILRSATLPGRLTGHIPVSILQEVQKGFLEETDYLNEGKNIDYFRKNLEPLAYLTIPQVYWDLTTERVLTMSYVEGETIRPFLSRKPSGELRNLIGDRLLEMYLFQVHALHNLHADPHPGNYLFDGLGGIGLVDFGCVTRFTSDYPELSRWLIEGARKKGEEDERRMVRLLWGSPKFSKNSRTRQMLKAVIDLYGTVYPPTENGKTVVDFGDPAVINVLTRNFQKALRNKLINPELAFAGRAELGLYNLLHQLKAKVNTREVWERVKARGEIRR
jgi:predicted unusual protein kinase regulating ubiquinone biosynthesis (AarF/ABC1/UbiB family)